LENHLVSTKVPVQVTVNGQRRSLEVEPRLLLVHLLRDELGLTGTHVGCDTASCGACTVHLDGASAKSCNILAVQADGGEVTTIEGIGTEVRPAPAAGGVLGQARPAVRLLHAGMIMAAADLLERTPNPARTRSATAWRATSAAARATTTSWPPCRRPRRSWAPPRPGRR
jgi:carbon-monoxide dehydrogenase small subunit